MSLKTRIQKLEDKAHQGDNEVIILHWDEPGELVKIGSWDRLPDETEDDFVARVEQIEKESVRKALFLWGEMKETVQGEGSFTFNDITHEEALELLD